MADVPFSAALRARTWSEHGDSESATFMSELLRGRGTREDYAAMSAQHFFIYRALENGEREAAQDPVAAAFLSKELSRVPALTDDLEFLFGARWQSRISPLPVTREYISRVQEVAATWPAGFIAHHYTRYLGDLSGGQAILRVLRKRYGFAERGVKFYLFHGITNVGAFKDTYRDRLDDAQWSAAERNRFIDEVIRAYRFNTRLFAELQASRQPATG